VSPYDGDTLTNNYPVFSWINTSLDSRALYSFVLVELNEDQNAEEGINSNMSYFRLENLNVSQLMYPFDAPALKENIWYAWQVQKYVGGTLTDKSEAWKFIISRPEFKESNKYVAMQREINGNIYEAINQKVYFKIDEKYYADLMRIEVYNDKMEIMLDEAKNDAKSGVNLGMVNKKTIGMNYYELDVSSISIPGFYILRVYDSKNQMYNLKFKIY